MLFLNFLISVTSSLLLKTRSFVLGRLVNELFNFDLKPLGERLESDKVGRSHDLANGGQKYAAQNKSAKVCSSKSERRMDLKECELNSLEGN